MSGPDFLIKVGATDPSLVVVLQDANGAVNLTGASSVEFRLSTSAGVALWTNPATITNAATGEVTYNWQPTDTASAGSFYGDFLVNYPDGTQDIFPSTGSIWIQITATGAAPSGVTLTQYRQRAASELGSFLASTAGSASTVNALIDPNWPILSSLSQDDLYVDHFLYRPNAATASDKTRLVKLYTPSTGTLVPDAPWAIAPVQGESYELHAIIPPVDLMGLINDALKRCFVPVEVTVTPQLDATRENITGAVPWLTGRHWIRAVGYLLNTESRELINPYWRKVRGREYLDGSNVYIAHPSIRLDPNTCTIYLRAIKPAYYHVLPAAGGNFGDQYGLSLEGDQAVPAEDWVAAATLIEVWRRYGHLLEPTANARLIRDRTEAAQWFSDLTAKYFVCPPLEFRDIETWGPRQQSWGPFIQ